MTGAALDVGRHFKPAIARENIVDGWIIGPLGALAARIKSNVMGAVAQKSLHFFQADQISALDRTGIVQA
jgi:hypothetical protein